MHVAYEKLLEGNSLSTLSSQGCCCLHILLENATVLFIFRFALHFNADVMTLNCHSWTSAQIFSERLHYLWFCDNFNKYFLFWQPLRRLRLRGGRFRPLAGCDLEAQDTPSTKRALSQCLRKSLAKIQGDDVLIGTCAPDDTNVTIILWHCRKVYSVWYGRVGTTNSITSDQVQQVFNDMDLYPSKSQGEKIWKPLE